MLLEELKQELDKFGEKDKEYTLNELHDLVEHILFEIPANKELTWTIRPYSGLPCALEVFEVNGIPANTDDFGKIVTSGDCMHGTCCSIFTAYDNPASVKVLAKYCINKEQFREIGTQLESELFVHNCGWCS